MKTILLLIVTAALSVALNTAFSQCDDFNSNEFEHTTSFWDWRSNVPGNYTAFLINDQNNIVSLALPNPFFAQSFSMPNVSDLYLYNSTKDFEPADGWELIYKSFGSSMDNWVENPGFVLYNRFTGMLRVFLWANSDLGTGANDAVLINKWDFGSQKASGLYSFTEAVSRSLDKFDQDARVSVVNIYQNPDGGMWLRFDITVAYDPCTCASSLEDGVLSPNISIMETSASLINTGDITLQATTTVTADNTVSNGQTGPAKQKAAIYQLNDEIKGGATRFDGYIKFWESTDDLVQTAAAFIKEDEKLKDVDYKKWKLPQGLKILPYVGQVLSIVDFFSTGGQKTATNNPSLVSQMTALKYHTSTTGSLTFQSPINGFSYYTPGCPHESITNEDPTLKPIYDHVLGVFNILKTPTLEYVQYGCNSNSTINEVYRSNYCESEISELCLQQALSIDMPQLWQFRLKQEPQFVINPASELELLDIEYSLDFQLDEPLGPTNSNINIAHVGTDLNVVHYRGTDFVCSVPGGNQLWGKMVIHPFLGPCYTHLHDPTLGSDFQSMLNEQGYQLLAWPKDSQTASTGTDDISKMTFGTGYAPGSCWDNLSFMIAHHPINTNSANAYAGDARYIYNELKPKLKVKCIFRRTDSEANENTEDVILISSFRCEIQESPLNLPFSGNPSLAHTYTCSNNKICVTHNGGNSFQVSSIYGEDYYISSLNDKNNPGSPVFTTGYAAFPYNDYLQGAIVLSESRRSSRNQTLITSAIVTTPLSSSEITATEEIIISGNSQINQNITLRLDHPMACSQEPMPIAMDPATVLTNFCPTLSYNPNIERSVATIDETPKEVSSSRALTLYPNPANNAVTVSVDSSDLIEKIEIYNSLGALVLSRSIEMLENENKNFRCDTSGIENGSYLVKLTYSDKKIHVMHLIIAR